MEISKNSGNESPRVWRRVPYLSHTPVVDPVAAKHLDSAGRRKPMELSRCRLSSRSAQSSVAHSTSYRLHDDDLRRITSILNCPLWFGPRRCCMHNTRSRRWLHSRFHQLVALPDGQVLYANRALPRVHLLPHRPGSLIVPRFRTSG
jgi:hypothetical protein